MLVVGGGQTSAHLAQLAVTRGASAVKLCSRKRINCKPYDVDVAYVGDRRPTFLHKFWQLDDFSKRKAYNGKLRNGGSMSSELYHELCTASDQIKIMQENEVVQAHWVPESSEIQIRFENGSLERFDYVWLATGGNFDMELVPMFASLQSQYPIPCIDGLP